MRLCYHCPWLFGCQSALYPTPDCLRTDGELREGTSRPADPHDARGRWVSVMFQPDDGSQDPIWCVWSPLCQIFLACVAKPWYASAVSAKCWWTAHLQTHVANSGRIATWSCTLGGCSEATCSCILHQQPMHNLSVLLVSFMLRILGTSNRSLAVV